jgi:solute carrier family 12 (potassium/chloride transporter), member 4/6
MFFLFMWFYL